MSTRKSARVAAKPKVVEKEDVSEEEEEEEEEVKVKKTKKSPTKAPGLFLLSSSPLFIFYISYYALARRLILLHS